MNFAQTVHEGILLDQLRHLFQDTSCIAKSRKQSCIKDPDTGAYLELDAWVPKHDISFEFQDAYHYVPIWYKQIKQAKIQQVDATKKDLILEHGTTLVQVPCWWDGAIDSLMASIHFQRPDLFTCVAPEIPLNPSLEFFQVGSIPSVGRLMLASFPEDPNLEVSSHKWWMGEKYDGVRLCWNASHKSVFSRTGKTLGVLPSLERQFTSTMCLDGEFWFGRGQFSNACLLFVGTAEVINWHSLRALLFDVASPSFHSQPFEIRYSHLLGAISSTNPFSIVVSRVLCSHIEHLNYVARNILDADGEGIMLRKVGSLYEPGRSQDLLKLKRFQGDQEAIVVRIGNEDPLVTIKMPTGQTVDVFSHNIHVSPLRTGDIVSFSCDTHARRAVPVNPQIHKIRTDLTWQEVLTNFRTEKHRFNAKSQVQGVTSSITNRTRKARQVLSAIAENYGKDPLLPQTWHSLCSELSLFVAKKFRGTYYHVLQRVFPEIPFAKNEGVWKEIGRRRDFFETYARQNRFDPLDPEQWYSQSISNIVAKGAHAIIRHYDNNVPQALQHLFPDIGFAENMNDPSSIKHLFIKFARDTNFDPHAAHNWQSQSRATLMDNLGINIAAHQYGGLTRVLMKFSPAAALRTLKLQLTYYKKIERRRLFFSQYAQEKSLDPNQSSCWYDISMDLPGLTSVPGISGVLFYHGGNLLQALVDLFPSVKLEKSKLRANYAAGKRRKIFEKFAQCAGFDPLDPENWYNCPSDRILSAEGVLKSLSYHENSLSKALVYLFPNIGLEALKLEVPVWREESVRRKCLEEYAARHDIDPLNPDAWYTAPLSQKGLPKEEADLLLYHNNSIQQSVVDLFPELKLDVAHFDSMLYWGDSCNRRRFFENYATIHGIDPHDPISWNSQPISRIMATKGAAKVMAHHVNVTKALCELFADAGFNPRQLQLKYN